MKPFKLVTAPNEILNKPVRKVERFDRDLKRLVKRMILTLQVQDDPPGVGLAANQVGVDLAVFVMQKDPSEKPFVAVNPKIIKLEGKLEKKEEENKELEGCLSIPKLWSPVDRYEKVVLEYQDLKGNKHTKEFQGLDAIIVQHEVDHLQGILFTKRALEQGKPLYKEEDGEFKEINL